MEQSLKDLLSSPRRKTSACQIYVDLTKRFKVCGKVHCYPPDVADFATLSTQKRLAGNSLSCGLEVTNESYYKTICVTIRVGWYQGGWLLGAWKSSVTGSWQVPWRPLQVWQGEVSLIFFRPCLSEIPCRINVVIIFLNLLLNYI